jgi:hypothetical protein
MRSRWTAWLFVLVLIGLTPHGGTAQSGPPQTQTRAKGPVVKLEQNSPNPMNPETWIPFTLGDYPVCSEPGREYSVSLTIFNTFAQTVAIPVLQRGTGNVAGGQQLRKLKLGCGEYVAYWNGKYLDTQREVSSGVYPYRLEVDGQGIVRKMTVTK